MKPTCENCRAWVPVEGHPQGLGECRFSPPTPMVVGAQQVPGKGLVGLPQSGQMIQPLISCQFPHVPRNCWCGCFRAANVTIHDDLFKVENNG